MKTTLLKSEDYTRSPWKNGGGIFTDIADAHRADAPAKDWDSLLWRFASTPIVAPGPFSYMPGIDRLQMVVGGRGLVLKSPTQDFDEREPFTTVRFTGEMEIVTALDTTLRRYQLPPVNTPSDCPPLLPCHAPTSGTYPVVP